MSTDRYDTVIGLEVHVQMLTRSKLFCRCSTAFGAPPNTQTCPGCAGLPGTLPVMNREAFRLALKTAVALNCEIPPSSKWDRKHYFYPDLPNGYQISQFDQPLSREGWLEIRDAKGAFEPKRIGIARAHLEEDAGKSMHDEAAGKADSRIDLNRCGMPLLEIVTHPDLRSPQEARVFLSELKLLLTYLGVSDCNMQEGSLRFDANVNLHIPTADGVVATPIVEVKNLNSFRAVERALAYETRRQYQAWQETGHRRGGPGGHKTTRGWDEQAEVTRPQRQKEESADYRYCPDPNLLPVLVSEAEVARVRSELGELPAAIRARLQETFGIGMDDAEVIVNQGRAVVDYFIAAAEACGDGKRASNWIQQDVLRALNERLIGIEAFPVSAAALGELLGLVQRGELDNSRARDVFHRMLESGQSVVEAVQSLGIASVDRGEIVELCRRVLADNPQAVAEIKAGKQKALGALIGQARRQNPNANPATVREICLELIGQS